MAEASSSVPEPERQPQQEEAGNEGARTPSRTSRRSVSRTASSTSQRDSHYSQQRGSVPPIPLLPSSNSVHPSATQEEPLTRPENSTGRHRSVRQGTSSSGHAARQQGTTTRPGRSSRQHSTQQHTSRPEGSRRRSSKRASGNDEGYTFGNDYNNLDEEAAPAPIQNPNERRSNRQEGYMESRDEPDSSSDAQRDHRGAGRRKRTSSWNDQDQELTELAAPSPIQNDDEKDARRKDEYLSEGGDSLDEIGDDDADTNDDRVSPTPDEPPPKEQRASEFATRLYVVSHLIFFSILGTLARLGVQWLTFYPGAPWVESVLWANFGGSLFMGFLSEDRRLFRDEWGPHNQNVATKRKEMEVEDDEKEKSDEEKKRDEEEFKKNHSKVKKTIPLYIGLATGFCGSFTSFSSFERDVFLALSNNLPTPRSHPVPDGTTPPSFTSTVHRNGGYSFMALFAIIIITMSLCLAALFIGAHIALASQRFLPTIPFHFGRKVLDRIMVVLAFGSWLGAVLLCIFPPDRPSGSASRGTWANEVWRGEVLFALAFAPLGCLLRFYASLKLNGILATFPLGTFAVNVFGCAVEAMCYDVQHVPLNPVMGSIGGGRVACQVLQGIMDGFCGCLTTVSTFVAELQGLRRTHAYRYGAVSIGVGLGVMIVIMGSVRWSIGWGDTACVTMRTID